MHKVSPQKPYTNPSADCGARPERKVFAGGGAELTSLAGTSEGQDGDQVIMQLDMMRAYAGGIGGLVGMFAHEGMDKLQEVAETLFGRSGKR